MSVTDRQTTDGWATAYSELAKNQNFPAHKYDFVLRAPHSTFARVLHCRLLFLSFKSWICCQFT